MRVAYEAGLWQLLELFFLSDDTHEGFFAEDFAAWLAEHGGLLCSTAGFRELAAEATRLGDLPRVDDEPSYWPTVQRLVLVGQLEVAAKLLMAHPAYQALQDPEMAAKVRLGIKQKSRGSRVQVVSTRACFIASIPCAMFEGCLPCRCVLLCWLLRCLLCDVSSAVRCGTWHGNSACMLAA